jgi:hypothetical protein
VLTVVVVLVARLIQIQIVVGTRMKTWAMIVMEAALKSLTYRVPVPLPKSAHQAGDHHGAWLDTPKTPSSRSPTHDEATSEFDNARQG